MKQIGRVFTALVVVSLHAYSANAVTDVIPSSNVSALFYLNDPNQGDSEQSTGGTTSASNDATHSPAKAFPVQPTPMTGREKLYFYLGSTYGPKSIISSAASSGIRQARDSVQEWGQGMEGYGKRFASSMGQKAVKQSIQFGFQCLLREDPRFYASGRTGMLRRTVHAVGQTFVSHKDSGGIRFAYSRFAGVIGGVCISRQWYPDDDRSAIQYVSAGASSIALDMLRNILGEFWPDLKRRIHH